MKKTFRKITALGTVLLLSLSVLAYASDCSVTITREKNAAGDLLQRLVIRGELDTYAENEKLSVKVYPAGATESNLAITDYILLDQIRVGKDGSFSLDKPMAATPDNYNVVVTATNETFPTEIYFSSLDVVNQLIADLNTEGKLTAAQVVEKIATENKELIFDTGIYGLLSYSTQVQIITDMMDEVDTFDMNNLYDSFNRHTLFNALKTLSSATDIQKALANYEATYLNLKNDSIYQLFSNLESDEQNDVYTMIGQQTFTTVQQVKDRFLEAVVLTAIKNVTSYLNIYDILEDYAAEIGCESQFAELSANGTTKKVVLRYLVTEEKNLNSLEDLISKLNYALDNVDKLKEGQSSSNGNTGVTGTTIKIDPSLNAVDKPTVPTQIGFNDLGSVEWARTAINALSNQNILAGKGAGVFAPEDNVTRAEIVKMIVAGLGIHDASAVSKFADAQNHWGNSYIASAFNKGYVVGVSNDMFGADDNITRQDVATILYRILQVNADTTKVETIKTDFSDIDQAADYAQRSIMMLNEYDIINGFEDGTFRPQNALTRAEAAVLIHNFLNYVNQ